MSNSKLFIGIGIGVAIGGVLGYLTSLCPASKMRKERYHAAHGLEGDAYLMAHSAKEEAKHVGAQIAGKVAEKAGAIKDK